MGLANIPDTVHTASVRNHTAALVDALRHAPALQLTAHRSRDDDTANSRAASHNLAVALIAVHLLLLHEGPL